MENREVKPSRLKRFIKESWRVLRITKRPNRDEFKNLVKVTGIGVAILGAIGFIIFLIKQLLF
jgi:protein transport protein SEC61 subunit gamma and related proteins